ncbi:MAG TPA: hypothetical protein VM487_04740 [Phycisphaerae bacterium]|nr:hypothetical protein [Phycisphaerae bacterium]
MTIRTHLIAGRRWRITGQARLRPPDLAECDEATRTLRIPVDGDTRDELEWIIHEVLHAACAWMSEATVDATACAAARLLWRLGWRKQEEDA